jgi:hypothetical protein
MRSSGRPARRAPSFSAARPCGHRPTRRQIHALRVPLALDDHRFWMVVLDNSKDWPNRPSLTNCLPTLRLAFDTRCGPSVFRRGVARKRAAARASGIRSAHRGPSREIGGLAMVMIGIDHTSGPTPRSRSIPRSGCLTSGSCGPPANRCRSCWSGSSASTLVIGSGRSSPPEGSAICWPSSSSPPANTSYIPATLASRVRVLGTGRSDKNDPNDAGCDRGAPRRGAGPGADRGPRLGAPAGVALAHQLGWSYNKTACRLHALMADLVPGGISKEVSHDPVPQLLRPAKRKGAPHAWRALARGDETLRLRAREAPFLKESDHANCVDGVDPVTTARRHQPVKAPVGSDDGEPTLPVLDRRRLVPVSVGEQRPHARRRA